MNRAWISRGFDRIAPVYEHLRNGFYPTIRKGHQAFEQLSFQPNNVVVAGGGTGDLLTALREIWPSSNLIYVDVSERMTQLARKRFSLAESESIVFETESIMDYLPPAHTDTLIFPFVLDCFTTSELAKLRQHVERNYPSLHQIVVFDFFPQPDRFWQRIQLWFLYACFAPLLGRWMQHPPDYDHAIPPSFTRQQVVAWKNGFLQLQVFSQTNSLAQPG